MKALLSMAMPGLSLGAGSAAQAQGCGNGNGGGGGGTVCLTAAGTPDNVQPGWTVRGSVTGVQVHRDPDTYPDGGSRLAVIVGKYGACVRPN